MEGFNALYILLFLEKYFHFMFIHGRTDPLIFHTFLPFKIAACHTLSFYSTGKTQRRKWKSRDSPRSQKGEISTEFLRSRKNESVNQINYDRFRTQIVS